MDALSTKKISNDSTSSQSISQFFGAAWCWAQLGWHDFLFQYRRTVIGPLWETLQIALWATALIWIFGRFHSDNPAYVPYVVTGLVGWGLISSILTAGPSVFTSSSALILNVPNPLLLHVVRMAARLVSRFAFQLLIFVPAVFYFNVPLNSNTLLTVIGAALLTVAAIGAMTVLGVIGARVRDLQQGVSALMRFLFFATPVFWVPAPNTTQAFFATYNPFSYALDVLRLPLLGQTPSALAYFVVAMCACLSVLAAAVVVRAYGRQVPNWL